MNLTIFMAGLACVIAAIVGGGLSMAGVSVPTLRSTRRQAMLALAGAGVIVVSFLVAGGGDSKGAPTGETTPPLTSSPFVFPDDVPGGETAIKLSVLEGPPGTPLQVSGSGFGSNETVVIRFHTQTLAETRTDGSGTFAPVSVRVPPDWQFKGQFDVVATGRQSIRAARQPFLVR